MPVSIPMSVYELLELEVTFRCCSTSADNQSKIKSNRYGRTHDHYQGIVDRR